MPKFGQKSTNNLSTCHPDLQKVFKEVVKHFDCSIECGYRGEDAQNELYLAIPPRTTVQFPNSKHNSLPSRGIDVAPYPINWQDRDRFHFFAGFVKGIAQGMGIKLRWGGDWDSDTEVNDNNFDDLVHFELVED